MASQGATVWVDRVREFLVAPSTSAGAAAALAAWQDFWTAAPEQVVSGVFVLLLAMLGDSVLGTRRAVKEGKFRLRALLIKPLDKALTYLGILLVAILLGAQVGIPHNILFGAVVGLTIRDLGSCLNHIDGITDGRLSLKGGVLESLFHLLEGLRESKRQELWEPVQRTLQQTPDTPVGPPGD